MNLFRGIVGKEKRGSDGRKVARANLSIVAVVSVLVLITATAMVTTAQQPPTSFHTYGWVKYNNGTAVLGQNVTITNLNTTPSPEVFNAEKNMSYDYYQLTISSYDVNASDVLRFHASDNGNKFI